MSPLRKANIGSAYRRAGGAMTTEFLFLADSGGISFYHHDDNGHIRDGLPAGQKPDLSLVYSASEIIRWCMIPQSPTWRIGGA